MKAKVITIRDYAYSEACAQRCIDSGAKHGVKVEKFDAVAQDAGFYILASHDLTWAWPEKGAELDMRTALTKRAYPTTDMGARVGCAMSHYLLWLECYTFNKPLLILEHDAVFLRPLPVIPEEFGAIMLNDPRGATPRGDWWHKQMVQKGPGVHRKTTVFTDGRPDGLAGNSAYIIHPAAAKQCIDLYRDVGVWPNDATLCRQLVVGLLETYPFVTEARQTKSTSGGY